MKTSRRRNGFSSLSAAAAVVIFGTFVLGAFCAPAGAQEGNDPLADLAFDMEQVVIDLSGMSTGEPVQTSQQQIVGKLDKLIAELEKESEQMRGGGANARPSRPMNDSMIKNGPGGMGDLHAARKNGKQWAELPPHERDRIVQSMTEGFPAHYQKILERYYKRLAEETPTGAATETGDGDGKADEPAKKPNNPPKKPAQPTAGKAAKSAVGDKDQAKQEKGSKS
ncbi:MAG TPA: hypothetical protein VHC22_17705 [Pirellulales bacterium]|nr:hypothetical protein [Pirellulales bacterium]